MRRHLNPGEHLHADRDTKCKLLVDGFEMPLAFAAHRYSGKEEVAIEFYEPNEGGHAFCDACGHVLTVKCEYPAHAVEVEFTDD